MELFVGSLGQGAGDSFEQIKTTSANLIKNVV